jgi:hypothetical protein
MGVPFEERNVSLDPRFKQEFRNKDYIELPTIEAGNTIITEYVGEPQLIEVLVKEGYL